MAKSFSQFIVERSSFDPRKKKPATLPLENNENDKYKEDYGPGAFGTSPKSETDLNNKKPEPPPSKEEVTKAKNSGSSQFLKGAARLAGFGDGIQNAAEEIGSNLDDDPDSFTDSLLKGAMKTGQIAAGNNPLAIGAMGLSKSADVLGNTLFVRQRDAQGRTIEGWNNKLRHVLKGEVLDVAHNLLNITQPLATKESLLTYIRGAGSAQLNMRNWNRGIDPGVLNPNYWQFYNNSQFPAGMTRPRT